jgi:hypothetical protein
MYMLKLPAVDILELFRRFDLNDASDLQDVNFVRRDIPDMNKIFIVLVFNANALLVCLSMLIANGEEINYSPVPS